MTPTYHAPTEADFTLKVKTLSKECFGSAGCLVEYRVSLGYDDTAGVLDPDVTYELTYQVRGGQEPRIDTIEVTGEKYDAPESDMIETKSSKSKLTAVLTEVSEQ